MNKTAKGALAAGTAAVLLMGGAGTLAYWSDAATINGGSASSGFLTLDAGSCDTTWAHVGGANDATVVDSFVPGDVITKDCTFTVGAEGDNLQATPTVPDSVTFTPADGTGASLDADVTATYELTKGSASRAVTAADTLTEADNAATLTASITVTIPFGDKDGAAGAAKNLNDTQNITATLADLTVALTQKVA